MFNVQCFTQEPFEGPLESTHAQCSRLVPTIWANRWRNLIVHLSLRLGPHAHRYGYLAGSGRSWPEFSLSSNDSSKGKTISTSLVLFPALDWPAWVDWIRDAPQWLWFTWSDLYYLSPLLSQSRLGASSSTQQENFARLCSFELSIFRPSGCQWPVTASGRLERAQRVASRITSLSSYLERLLRNREQNKAVTQISCFSAATSSPSSSLVFPSPARYANCCRQTLELLRAAQMAKASLATLVRAANKAHRSWSWSCICGSKRRWLGWVEQMKWKRRLVAQLRVFFNFPTQNYSSGQQQEQNNELNC